MCKINLSFYHFFHIQMYLKFLFCKKKFIKSLILLEINLTIYPIKKDCNRKLIF